MLFNLSIAASTVRSQWKQTYISPVPKATHPEVLDDFRPVSIAHNCCVHNVLTSIMERLTVAQFLYPAITFPSTKSKFSDQYASIPTGSPTAAISSLLHTVTHLLVDNPHVIVITVKHSIRLWYLRICFA